MASWKTVEFQGMLDNGGYRTSPYEAGMAFHDKDIRCFTPEVELRSPFFLAVLSHVLTYSPLNTSLCGRLVSTSSTERLNLYNFCRIVETSSP